MVKFIVSDKSTGKRKQFFFVNMAVMLATLKAKCGLGGSLKSLLEG